ncbi:MAG: hypothetical protein H7X94_03075 [Vallitaleaceae bacterium]|nr:hypothetical protein [Vallitaleaceae bacterium]
MKNKKVRMGVLVLAAVTVFTATAFASTSTYNNGGYEALKQIMKNSEETKHLSSTSFNGTFQMSDNGKVIAEVTGDVKENLEGKEASGNVQIKLMGKEQDLSFFKSGEESYLVDKTNAKYYQLVNMTKDTDEKHKAINREEAMGEQHMGKTGEALMDYLMGDLKSQFELTQNADGTKSITVDLNENEIPVPMNLLVGIAAENDSNSSNMDYEDGMDLAKKELLMGKMPFLKEFYELGKDMPKLKQDVKLTGISLKLNVDENDKIKSFDVKISTTGKDANGTYHEVSFSGSSFINDINSISVDTFSPDGKSIETIDAKDFNYSNK